MAPETILHCLLTAYRVMRYCTSMERKPVSYRLSTEALRLLCLLSTALGLSRTSVIEMAVRELAKRKGI